MTTLYTKDFDYKGRTFRAEVVADETGEPPWEMMTCYGEVSNWTRDDKRPGQRVLCADRGWVRYYDFAGAVAKARTEMAGEYAAEWAEREFDYLRRWCADDWHYVGVVVFPLTDRGDELRSYSDSLWGIESDATDHIDEVMLDLAHNIEM